ncbi:MAG: hypothetical protein ABIV06_02950 [Thermoanaerobaculia bacterium]
MTSFETEELKRIFTYLTLDELESLLRALVPQLEGLAESLDECGFFDAIEEGTEEDPLLECDVRLDGEDESFILQLFDEDEERFEAVFILSPAVAAVVVAALPPGALDPPQVSSAVH